MSVRVRIAPSPTGSLHVGNARSALFNWLYARHNDGVFILRIDDTDLERSTPEFEDEVLSSLRWLGLDWDEGVGVGGDHGTYRQSDRLDRYRDAALQLVESGAAYWDDRSVEELESLRQTAQKEGKHPGHYIRRPDQAQHSGVIRLSIPSDNSIVFEDLVRGGMSFEAEDVDDFVILRSNGTPTYHLASTVDDIDYEITHVARGEDLLPSTPKHIVLMEALGAQLPIYAHLPLLFGPDGKKLSKRHGETALSHYREAGYLPDAMFNYLCLLGWSIDGETTIFSKEEAIDAFDLVDISKNPATFDPAKLEWLNGEYVRAMNTQQFEAEILPFVETEIGRSLDDEEMETLAMMAPLIQERVKLLPEAGSQARFLFTGIEEFDEKSWEKVMTKDGVAEVLDAAVSLLTDMEIWNKEAIEDGLRQMLGDMGVGVGKGLQPMRVAVTGSSVSPPLFESMSALGKEETVSRLQHAAGLLT